MRKPKSIKSNEQTEVVTKDQIGEYVDFCDFRQIPVSLNYLSHLAKKLMTWAILDEQADKLSEFFVAQELCRDSFYRWVKKSPELHKAHSLAMMALGNRREKAGLRRVYDSGMVRSSMAIYDDDWKQLEEWRGKISQEQNKDNAQKVVVIESLTPCTHKTPEEVAGDAKNRTTDGRR